MKKLLLCLLSVFVITGCGNKVNLNLDKVKKNIDLLVKNEFDIYRVSESIEGNKKNNFSNLKSLYMSDLEKINIESSYVLEMVFRVSETDEPKYIIMKATDGNKEKLKSQIETYASDYLYKMVDFNDYLIYAFDDNSNSIINSIKKVKGSLFENLYYVNDNSFENMLGFKSSNVESYLIGISIDSNVERYFVIKPKNKTAVKIEMNKYFSKLEDDWSSTEDGSLIKNRLEKDYGDYLIYIISDDNDAVLEAIKNTKK